MECASNARIVAIVCPRARRLVLNMCVLGQLCKQGASKVSKWPCERGNGGLGMSSKVPHAWMGVGMHSFTHLVRV